MNGDTMTTPPATIIDRSASDKVTGIVVLINIPSPYRIPFFRLLSHLSRLHVVFDAQTEHGRAWTIPDFTDVPHSFARGVTLRQKRKRNDGIPDDYREIHIRYGVLLSLLKLKPNVVVAAEFGPRALMALCYCRLTRTPLILWSEGTPHSEGWVRGTKMYIRQLLVKSASRFWVNGLESAELIRHYGGDDSTIDRGMTGVDTQWFKEHVASCLPERNQLRHTFGLHGTVFVFVGQLIPRKGIAEFLNALSIVSERSSSFSVLLAGDGPQRVDVETWKARHPECTLRVLGHLTPENLVKAYAAADVFVLPTLDDNWSLATLEASVAGLPQIFSRYNGAVIDLTERGARGKVVDPFKTSEFAEALMEFIDEPTERLPVDIVNALSTYYSPLAFAERAFRSTQKATYGKNI